VCDVTALARVDGAQLHAYVARGAPHHTDVLVRYAVVGAYRLVQGRTGRWTDAEPAITHSTVSTADTVAHLWPHNALYI